MSAIRAPGLAIPLGQQILRLYLAFHVNRRRYVPSLGRNGVEHFVGDGKRLVVNWIHPPGLNILGLHPMFERAVRNHAIELPVPLRRFQEITVVASIRL